MKQSVASWLQLALALPYVYGHYVKLDGYLEAERLKQWFEDDPQATSSQTARRLKQQQAIFEVLRSVCWLVLDHCYGRLCAHHTVDESERSLQHNVP